jgi:hypothetical protein
VIEEDLMGFLIIWVFLVVIGAAPNLIIQMPGISDYTVTAPK